MPTCGTWRSRKSGNHQLARPSSTITAGTSTQRTIVASIATAIALVLGTLASLAVQRYDFFGRQTISFFLVLPIALPGVVTVGILAFIASWNSYILPLFILNGEGSYTLPLGVQAFSSQYSVDTAKVLAFTSVSMIPALIFFTIFQRRIVGGLTGAVKG